MSPSSIGEFRNTRWPLTMGLFASLAVHALLIVPGLMAVLTVSAEPRAMQATFQPEVIRKSEGHAEDKPKDEEPDLRLGLDRGNPSTLTWIGYEEYQVHLAQLSEVEQAAFTDDPVAGTQNAARTMATDSPPAESADASPSELTAEKLKQAQTLLASFMERLQEQFQPPPTGLATAGDVKLPEGIVLAPLANAETLLRIIESETTSKLIAAAGATSQDIKEPAAATTSESQDTHAAQSATPPQKPDTSAKPPTAGAGGSGVGEQSDKDAAPTSTIEVPIDQIRIGKPFAARGLEVKPQRPQFSILQRLTAAPASPLVEVHFGREGKPQAATRLIEGTGNSDFDEAILASLFRWRASGEQLQQLSSNETVRLQIRILLHARRR